MTVMDLDTGSSSQEKEQCKETLVQALWIAARPVELPRFGGTSNIIAPASIEFSRGTSSICVRRAIVRLERR